MPTATPYFMRQYGFDAPAGIAGLQGPDAIIDSATNVGNVAQVSRIVVNTADNSHAYVIVLNGISITYTSDGTATVAEVADGLASAGKGEQLRGQVPGVVDADFGFLEEWGDLLDSRGHASE